MKPRFALPNFLALAGSSLLAISSASAATLYWDGLTPAGAPGGGAGTWDTTLTNWDTLFTGNDVAWINANNDIAVFGGTAATVTLGSNISVGGLRFDTTGYTITTTGAYALSFNATNNTILLNNAIAAAAITGTVAGTGNLILSNASGTNTSGTLTFSGTSATGWSGATTIGAGMTLATVSTATLINKVLSSTTGGITLNSGTIQFTRASNADIDAINNSAIGVNGGGTFSVTSSGGGASASETIGTVTVNSGQMNFVQTANNANSLVLGGLSRGLSNTSAVNFSSAALGIAKIVVTGAGGLTAANEIYAPWATVGITANTQTDYAVFNASNEVGARGTAASAQSTWSTAHAATSNYTLTNAAGSVANGLLSATRKVNTVRNTTASSSATATNGGVATLDYFSLAGHTFANGDVVSASGTGGLANGGETYYVINSGVGAADRFQLSTTSGGSAVDLTNTTAGTIAGGITLSTGNNLETYGILNGSTANMAIGASGTGALTTPTGGGSLYLTTGAGGIFINAPITNAVGGGVVTVVKNGSAGRLVLSGNNTFTGGLVVNGGNVRLTGTQNFAGGITLSGGGIGDNSANGTLTTAATALNGNAVTVNGPSALVVEGTTTSSIAINPNAVLKLGAGNSVLTVQGVVSGSGVLDVNANNFNTAYTVNLTNTANTFSGDVTYNASNGSNQILSVASIGDSGKVSVGMYLNAAIKTFEMNSAATANLVFNTRQFELSGPAGTHNLVIDNNSARSFNINTDLLTSGLGTRTLNLQGAGAGLSTFAGKIETGTLTTLGITKSEAGTWVLSGANTYNGKTTVSAGTLSVNSIQNDESTTANALGTPGVGTNSIIDIATTGILRYTGTGHSSDRVINMTGNGGTYTVDASGTGTGLALTGGMTAGGTSGTSTLALTGTGLGSQSGAISNGTSTNVAAVTKSGTGTWTLGATNTYTGSTTLNAGTLKLNYDTGSGGTTGSKLSDTASIGTLLLNGGTLELSGGSSLTETVLSTTLNTGGTFIKQTGGDTKLWMGAITFTAGAIDFSAGSIATTTTGTASTLLNQRATVAGTNFAMKDAGNTNIVAYDYVTSGSTGYTGAAMTANINYALTSNAANTLAGTTGATSNTLKIANTATASLAVAGNTLTLGAILFAGSANYDITTSGAGKITPSILHNYGTGGAVLNLGALGGALTQFGTGKTILTSAALANAGVTVNGGTVQFSTNAQLGTPSNGAALTLNNGTLLASETVTLDNGGLNIRGVTLNSGGGTLAAASTKTLTVSGVISGALNPLTIGSVGNTGTVTLSGTNTYTGATNINNGILAVSNAGSINSTSAINVAAGAKFVYNSSTSLTKAPILAGDGISNRAVLGGAGSIGVAVTLDNLGDVLSPGNSPGIQTYTTAQSWSSFTYDWEVNDFTGPDAGTAFDQLRLTTLDLTGGSGSYVLNVLGLTAGNTTGLVPNFSEISRSWTILTTSAGISNFNTASWSINTTGFSDPDTGNWSLAQSGNDLVLSYTVIPEPKAALLGGLGIILLLRRRR